MLCCHEETWPAQPIKDAKVTFLSL
ncbi:hypothetical protein GQ600_25880 [Phytophthora cactorum]|nr:hypothetical protein GQ600_25880 [Phytophthora cactorum]